MIIHGPNALRVSALGYVAVCWGALYFLYRKNIFFRA